jgi:hypothetical protein
VFASGALASLVVEASIDGAAASPSALPASPDPSTLDVPVSVPHAATIAATSAPIDPRMLLPTIRS